MCGLVQLYFVEVFLFKSMRGEMIRGWRVYSCSRKEGKDLKTNVSGFIKDFLF